jgi:O-antigen/teichoic acid export membrane protein
VGLTLALLTVGIGISNIAGLASSLFYAAERMEVPALVAIFTSAAKVVSGVGVITLGFGIVGIAFVAIGVNLVTGCVLLALLIRSLGRPHPIPSPAVGAELMRSSYPLLINNLLASMFFRVDGLILHAGAGADALAWYGTAYKFLEGLNTIPSNLTLALFPLLSRLATRERDPAAVQGPRSDFARTVELAMRGLVSLAVPIAVGTTILAEPIIRAFAGTQYLPHSAIALGILIWFAPFSFVNGLLQYVLIAIEKQRFISVAFAIATAFNVVTNVVAVAHWSYVGAAVITVASEILLLGLFWSVLRRDIAFGGMVSQTWRCAIAAGVMGPVVWGVAGVTPVLAVAAGVITYLAVLIALKGIRQEEITLLRLSLPGGHHQ